MPRTCAITGKKPTKGNHYSIRGIAKKKKGIGLKITGIQKRRFKPNLKRKRLWCDKQNKFITLKVSSKGLRIINRLGLAKTLSKIKKRKKAAA